MLGEYHRTGFLWEQYDDKVRVGVRVGGWSCLGYVRVRVRVKVRVRVIARIMARVRVRIRVRVIVMVRVALLIDFCWSRCFPLTIVFTAVSSPIPLAVRRGSASGVTPLLAGRRSL